VAVFLHTRVQTAARLIELASAGAEEGQHLEFKPNVSDAAKEVAALANADGGDLVVGAHTNRDPGTNRDRWANWAQPPYASEKDLRQRLQNGLAPREVADSVDIIPLEVLGGSRPVTVLVANVPPWPHGPVAFQSERDVQHGHFRFPVRRDAHTRYLSFEEIMRSNDGRRRSTYLRLREFVPQGRVPADVLFRFYSPLRGRAGGFEPGDVDGTIFELTPDVLVLSIHQRQELWGVGPGDLRLTDIPPRKVAVPLELVLAASRDPAIPASVALTLSVPLQWDGRAWTFVHPGGGT